MAVGIHLPRHLPHHLPHHRTIIPRFRPTHLWPVVPERNFPCYDGKRVRGGSLVQRTGMDTVAKVGDQGVELGDCGDG